MNQKKLLLSSHGLLVHFKHSLIIKKRFGRAPPRFSLEAASVALPNKPCSMLKHSATNSLVDRLAC